MEGKHDHKEWDLNLEHLFPRISGYKRRSDIEEVDKEFRVYTNHLLYIIGYRCKCSIWVLNVYFFQLACFS